MGNLGYVNARPYIRDLSSYQDGWNSPYVWAPSTFTVDKWPAIVSLLNAFVTEKRLLRRPNEYDLLTVSSWVSQNVWASNIFTIDKWPAIASLLNVFIANKRTQTIGHDFSNVDAWNNPYVWAPGSFTSDEWPGIEAMLHAFRTAPRGGSVYNVDDTFIVDWIQGILLIGTFILFENVAMANIGITDATMAPGAYLDDVTIVKDIDSVREGMVSD